MPLVCDKLSIRLKEQGLRKYDLRKDKIIGMSALGKLCWAWVTSAPRPGCR